MSLALVVSGGPTASVLFMCEHTLRCRQTGRCERARGGKNCSNGGWMGRAPCRLQSPAQLDVARACHPCTALGYGSWCQEMLPTSFWPSQRRDRHLRRVSRPLFKEGVKHLCREVWREPRITPQLVPGWVVSCLERVPACPRCGEARGEFLSLVLSPRRCWAALGTFLPHWSASLPPGRDCLGHF